jgi:4-amino-4-deoxy-L-arabinose transferase-like glycosyltransferase
MTLRKTYFLAVIIILLAFALRIAAIDRTPAGLSHDEAYNGIAALEVVDGHYRLFYEINKGIEPLIIWLEGWAFQLFGVGPVQLRLVNIVAGLFTVVLVYPLAARLFDRRIALLAMAVLAISFWAVFVSRLTLRAVLLPPLLLLTLHTYWQALDPAGRNGDSFWRTLIYFALSGLLAGVTMYTYLSSRFVPLILLALFGYQLLLRKITRRHWLGAVVMAAIWAAVFLPLALYFQENSESFIRRSSQVTTIPYALNGDFGPLADNTLRTIAMFSFEGDTTDRYNLDGRPVFNPINSILFYLGLGLLFWRLFRTPRRATREVLLLSALLFMLLPDFITDDSPHFLRTIGALPLVYLIWALGTNAVLRWVGNRSRHATMLPPPVRAYLATGLLLFLLGTTLWQNGYDYFVRWHQATEARNIYGADIAAAANYLKASPSDDLTAISAAYYRDLDRFRMDLHFGGRSPFMIWFDGRQSLAFPPPESGLSPRYIFPASASPPETFTSLLEPDISAGNPEFSVYRLPAAEAREQLLGRHRAGKCECQRRPRYIGVSASE